jgi:hypothetical protein
MAATVMISCWQREEARAATVPQLAAAGFEPKVFLSPCEPAGPEGNREVAHRAMQWALEQEDDVLFVEDDIDLAPDFAWHARVAQELDAVTYLYLNDTPGRLREILGPRTAEAIIERRPIVRGAYRVRNRSAHLYGTQCVMVPQRLVGTMVAALESPHPVVKPAAWDSRLHAWARHNPEEPVYVMLPHPVQHRQDRTGRDPAHRPMRSMSFGMNSTSPWLYPVVEPFPGKTGKFRVN